MLRRCRARAVSSLKGAEPGVWRRAVAVLVAVAAFAAGAQPAYAAPPVNDTPSGATLITALPFSDTVTIDEATTDALDEALPSPCSAGIPFVGSVWYRFEATEDGALMVDFIESSFSAGTLVTLGDPANGNVVACGWGSVVFEVTAGQTYFIMAFSDTPSVTTGTLVIHADVLPPPPEVDVTVDPTGTFNSKTGSATISGTVECSGAEFAFIEVNVNQNVGRLVTISGYNLAEPACTGTPQPWSVEVLPTSGKFKGGKAVSVASAVVCGDFTCGFDFEQTTVRLRGH